MKEVSIIIPVYNEEGNVEELHREIKLICEGRYTYEIILVDDGSTYHTYEIAKKLSPVKIIQLRRNFGQTAAMDAGIREAQYEFIVTMDGDRQNNPNDIPKLLDYLDEQNLDVVSGWRKNRKDTIFKHITSRGANFLRAIIIKDGIHDSGCSLKVYKKECFEQVALFGEMHRFIPAVLKIKGFKIGEMVVDHRFRIHGKTKYNWRRTFKGFVDMISVWFWNKYAVKPLHLLGGMGLFSIFTGIVTSIYTLYLYIETGKVGHTAWPVLSVFFMFTGILLFVLGLIADILSKSYYQTTKDRSYNIKKITNN